MCGAKSSKECDEIYENKWKMRWYAFEDYFAIVIVIGFIVLGIIALCSCWYLRTGISLPWE